MIFFPKWLQMLNTCVSLAALTERLWEEDTVVTAGVQHHGMCAETHVGAVGVHTLPADTQRLIHTLVDVCQETQSGTDTQLSHTDFWSRRVKPTRRWILKHTQETLTQSSKRSS